VSEETEAFGDLAALVRRLVLAGRSSLGHGGRVRDHDRASCDLCTAVVQGQSFLEQADDFEAKQAVVAETMENLVYGDRSPLMALKKPAVDR